MDKIDEAANLIAAAIALSLLAILLWNKVHKEKRGDTNDEDKDEDS